MRPSCAKDWTHTYIYLKHYVYWDQHIRWGGTKWKQAIWQSVQPLKRVVVLPLQSQWNLRTTDTTRADLGNWLGEILYVRIPQSWNKHFSSHMLSEVAKITSSQEVLHALIPRKCVQVSAGFTDQDNGGSYEPLWNLQLWWLSGLRNLVLSDCVEVSMKWCHWKDEVDWGLMNT